MSLVPFFDSRELLANPAGLHARMQQDGFLYVSRLLPEEAFQPVAEAIYRLCRESGWADEANQAIPPPRLEGFPEWWEVYDPLQRLEAFHALAHRPELIRLAEAVVQETALAHPRNIGRITFPDAAHFTTPAHQDYPLIQGTPETYTAWMPLCDCPMRLGGLAMLAGSHRFGLFPVHRAQGPGGMTVETDSLGLTWQGQDMNAGDVILFHSHTVHRALPNLSEHGLRISADYRYQGASQPIVADSLLPHYGRLTWEQIYAGWENPDLPYYWRKLSPKIAERDFEIMRPVEAEPEPQAS